MINKHKAIRFFLVVFVLILQFTFLALIIKENYETDSYLIIGFLLFICLLGLFSYQYLDLHPKEYSYEDLSVLIAVPIGAVFCYSLNIKSGFGSVLSAGIIGTLASLIPLINKESAYLKKLPAAIYCGVFIGMSNIEIAPSLGFIVFAGIIAGGFLFLSKNLFVGIGGKLGTIAFIGVILATLINWLL